MKLAGLAISILLAGSAAPADNCRAAASYDCAVSLVQQQQFEPAVAILEKIVAQTPKNPRALNLLGIALTGAGQIDKANARFRQVLKLDPRFVPAMKNLAVNEFTLNHRAAAKSGFDRVLKLSPDDEIAHLYLADIAFEAKQLATALDHYEKVRSRVVQNPRATLRYSECLAQAGRIKDAGAALTSLPPDDQEGQFQAGLILGRSGAFLDAAHFFRQARQRSPDPYTAGYNEVLMLIRGGDYASAIQTGAILFDQNLKRAELYNLISEAYLKTGQVERAYNALRTATELDPGAEDHYVDLAGICLDYENYDLGLEIVDIGLRHLPNSFRLRLHRGVMLAQKGLAQEAEKDFELAAKLSSGESLPYAALGMAWMQQGETARAVEALRAQVKKSLNDFMLPYILGIALLRSGAEPGTEMGVEARRAFEASVRLNPKFGRAHAELGKLLLKEDNVKGGIAELETAVNLDPKDGAAAYQLSRAYRRAGDSVRAQQMLARVTELRDQKEGVDPRAEMKRIVREGAVSRDRVLTQ